MQRNSIHNPAHTENAQTQNPFPTSGDNFTTVINIGDAPDLIALMQAVDFLEDCTVALAAFEQEQKRTGTT